MWETEQAAIKGAELAADYANVSIAWINVGDLYQKPSP
jgi:hypothetical protein